MDHRIVKLLVPILLVTFRQAEAVEVWIGEFSAVAGESAVVVPVEVSGAVGMAGGDLVITYEAAVLNAVAVESGDLSSAWLVSANLNGVGVIRVSMAGSQGSATATGSLLMLRFEVQPEVAPGTVTLIGLESVSLNDELADALPVTTIGDGSWTVPEGPGPLTEPEAVQVWIGEINAVADESGQSQIVVPVEVSGALGVAGGDLVITYEAEVLTAQEVVAGDLSSAWLVSANLNGAGVIRVSMAGSQGSTAGTGSLLALHFGVQPEVAAGTVTLIGLESVSLNDELADALPVTTTGDGSWTVPEGPGPLPEPEAAEVWIGEISVITGESGQSQVVVPVEVGGALGVAGGDLVITYDAGVLTAVAVESGDLSSTWLVSANLNEAGVLRVSLAGSQGSATATGSLLTVRFQVQPEVAAGRVTQISLESVSLNDEMANALPVTAIGDGSWTVPAGPAPLTGDFDGDGSVGWLDVDAFREVFGQDAPPAGPMFDLDDDGYVGFLDLFLFADNFGAETEHPSQ